MLASDTVNYLVTVNGVKYGQGYTACSADTIYSYTYFPLTLSSPTGPYNLQSWNANGKIITAVVPNIRALVDSMNKWDIGGNWRLDASRYTISGGKAGNTYGSMIWTKNGAKIATLNPNKQTVTRNVGLWADMGKNNIIFKHILTGCTDTAVITVSCQGAAPTDIVRRTPKLMETINLNVEFGKEGAYCLSIDHLNGVAYQLKNICEPNTTDNVNFIFKDNCIIFSGDNIGVDTACVTICDGTGVCDTVKLVINVIEEGKLLTPIAVNDKASTLKHNEVIIKPMLNDTTYGIESNIRVIKNPENGSVTLNDATGQVTYRQTSIDCVTRDSFLYAIVNESGSDTAWVKVEVICDDVVVFSGFSPNEDGVNDRFMIMGLEKYPNHTLMVFNQLGYQVYQAENYNNQWDGTMDGKPLPEGTYFWVLDLGTGRKLSGYVQLHR
jgi:gliding motility-associated-like protein